MTLEILGERVLLREFTVADHDAVHAYAADPEVTRYTDWGPNTPEDTAAFLHVTIADVAVVPRSHFALAVVDIATGALVGSVALHVSGPAHARADIGYVLTRSYWGRGLATEAAALLLAYGFDQLHLHKIAATCDPENLASARVLEKIGMIREGYLREHLLIGGRWRDRLLFAAFAG